jgi:hypothetical protein
MSGSNELEEGMVLAQSDTPSQHLLEESKETWVWQDVDARSVTA